MKQVSKIVNGKIQFFSRKKEFMLLCEALERILKMQEKN